MKTRNFIALCIALTLVFIIFPGFVILLYSKTISGSYFPAASVDINNALSKSSTEWANFGSLLSGLFTFSGALATATTLIFLCYQHIQLSKERRWQLDREEEITAKNNEYMEMEKEKIAFEKYKLHREMFNDILNKTERRFDNEFVFINRTALYRDIFSKNNFYHCDVVIDLGQESEATGIKYILVLAEQLKNKLMSFNVKGKIKPEDIIHTMLSLGSKLGFTFNRPEKEGDIIFIGKDIIMNIQDFNLLTRFIECIIEEMLLFGNAASKKFSFDYNTNIDFFAAMYTAGDYYNKSQERDSSFPFTLKLMNGNSVKAFEVYYRLNNYDKKRISNLFGYVRDYLSDERRINKLHINEEFKLFTIQLGQCLEPDIKYIKDKVTSEEMEDINRLSNYLYGLRSSFIVHKLV